MGSVSLVRDGRRRAFTISTNSRILGHPNKINGFGAPKKAPAVVGHPFLHPILPQHAAADD